MSTAVAIAKVLSVTEDSEADGVPRWVITVRSEEAEPWKPLSLHLSYSNFIRLHRDIQEFVGNSKALKEAGRTEQQVPEPHELPFFDEDEEGNEVLRVNDWPGF